jgi:hypothetical protein
VDSSDLNGSLPLAHCEPKEWFIVFHEETDKWWINALACGRFKHVSVFGKVERSGSWVFYDFHADQAHIMVVGDWEADIAIAYYTQCGPIIRFPRLLADAPRTMLRPGLWCVPAIAHLIGLRTCALRPDTLYRHCLAKGGTLVVAGRQTDEDSEDGKGSGTGAPESGGSDGEGERDSGPSVDRD